MGHIVYISRVILRLCNISLCSRLTFSNIKKCMDVMGEGGRGFQDNVHWTLFKIFLIFRYPLIPLPVLSKIRTFLIEIF